MTSTKVSIQPSELSLNSFGFFVLDLGCFSTVPGFLDTLLGPFAQVLGYFDGVFVHFGTVLVLLCTLLGPFAQVLGIFVTVPGLF